MADDPLLTAAGRIADGDVVDWVSVTGSLSTDRDRGIADELAVVQQIAAGHRALHQLLPAATDTPPNLAPDRARWAHLELLNVVGRGSYGTVYRAWDPRLERLVALKLFHGAADPDAVMQEGRMLARVRHENVVTVYGADVIDGVAGIWMEMVHGETLDQIVRKQGPMPARDAAAAGADIARALGAIHGAGLLHCDVKAQNVVRETGGRVVLMDLGAGRLVPEARDTDHLSDVAGTPRYMAPELFVAGAMPTKATDVYSLGVLLFYLVSGKFPVDGRTLGELKRAHEKGERRSLDDVRPTLAPAFQTVVANALSTNAAVRPQTADLQSALSLLGRASPSRRSSMVFWIAATVAVTLIGAGILQTRRTFGSPPSPQSLAVLPISNATGDAANDFFADSLTEGLTRGFSRIHTLRVPTAAAVASIKSGDAPSARTSERLGVQVLVAGELVNEGAAFRLILHVADAAGTERLRRSFDADRNAVLNLPNDAIRAVAETLGVALPARQPMQTALDTRAQIAYYRGLSLSRQGLRQSRESIQFFEQAVQIEPNFAAAWAELALAKSNVVPAAEVREEYLAEIRGDAERAVSLDPELGAGYAALGNEQFYYEWNFRAAEQTFRKALEVEPSYAFARQRLAMLLAALGRVDEGIELARESQLIEPLYSLRTEALGTLYYYRRDFDNAMAQMRRALEVSPQSAAAHYGLGRIYSALGRHDDAAREIEAAMNGNRVTAYLAELERVYAAAGDQARKAAVRAELDERARNGDRETPDRAAYVAAAEGRADDALQILRTVVFERNQNLLWIAVDPRVDPLRGDPRFDALLRSAGLIP